MKSRLAIAVTLSGWILFVAYVFYDYVVYRDQIFNHLFQPPYRYELFFHILMLSVPIGSTLTGCLINERKKLLIAVKASEEKYCDLYQNAPDGYHSIGPDGTILEVNDTWLKMLGYERDEVIGKMKLTELLTDEGLKTFEKCFSVFKEKGYIENLEFDFRRKDGTFLPVIINATAVYDKNGRFLRSRGIVRDNTARKGYERSLRHASSEWRATFDSMPYGVMLLDGEFNIIRTNEYIAKISGIPIKELIGRKCYEVIHGQDRPIEGCPVSRSIETNKAAELEYYEPKLGIHFMMDSTPVFDEGGSAIAYVASLVDITELKQKEKKLTESRDAFLNMLRDTTSSYMELKEIYNDLILAFANAIDAKSRWTSGHSHRVANYALSIANEMDLKEEMDTLWIGALLHDVGKIGTYDVVLDKPDKLTDEEFALVKMHPVRGEEILRPIKELHRILPIVRSHHERIDGKGYPDGLKDDEIPFLARILCVADSFDSMTADRPYRPAPGKEYAISELKRCAGTQFDPQVVEAFLRVVEGI
jgi:PAS domain S-box-containing protein/putative nucleotidyltransferase with HDIG domain